MASQKRIGMDIERLVSIGKEMGLEGAELRVFVSEEQERMKLERKEKENVEREKRAAQFELRKQEQETLGLQLELEAMKKEKVTTGEHTDHSNKTNLKSRSPKLPAFDDDKDELDAYLQRFERYATAQSWPEDNWAINLSALLKGKALEVYSRLAVSEASSYNCLKTALLKRYHLTEEGFRQKLRTAKPEKFEGPRQFVVRLDNYFCRWTDLAKINKNFDGLKDLLLREQFINASSLDLSLFLKERKPKDVATMAELAEKFVEARGGVFGQDIKPSNFSSHRSDRTRDHNQRYDRTPKPTGQNKQFDRRQPTNVNKPGSRNLTYPRQIPECYYCGKTGHIARNCYSNPNRSPTKIAGLITQHSPISDQFSYTGSQQNVQQQPTPMSQHQQGDCERCGHHPNTTPPGGEQVHIACMNVSDCCSHGGFVTLKCGHNLPIMSAACKAEFVRGMPVTQGKVGGNTVSVLRDTGCSGVLIRRSLVSNDQLTGTNKYCVFVDNTVRQLPLAHVTIDSPYFIGPVEAVCMTDPIYDVIVGNIPQARDPGNPDPKWTCEDNTISRQKTNLERKQKETYLHIHAVQTRAQKAAEDKPLRALKVSSALPEVTANELHQGQQDDPTLQRVRELAKSGEPKVGKGENSSHFFIKKGLIYRHFRSPRVESGNTITQLIVPKPQRVLVMKLAHESILGGHQGFKKTADKVLSNFFWPGVQSDIQRYCRSCDICQRTIPKGKVTRVPLGHMPLIEVPFQRIAVDIVGPISPMTDRGHRYVVTMVDYATRYPEAIPLKSIETHRVAEALIEVFTRVGVPREILTDQGAQFTSGVMKEVSRLLSIKQLTTTPYHPACNGLVERFNGSLKQMLKRLCAERPKDWDRYIGPLLFAYRETPHASTGFAPFELLYGRTVRGPMAILKELWSDNIEIPEVKTTYQYVLDLRSRIEDTCQLAKEELKKSSERYRKYYDRKARPRQFKGDKVLLLLPADNNKLLLQWKGPYPVIKRMSNCDYTIDLGSRTKTFHINLLKLYMEPSTTDNQTECCSFSQILPTWIFDIAATAVIEPEEDPTEFQFIDNDSVRLPSLTAKESSSDVNVCKELDADKVHEIREVLAKHNTVLTDLPGQSNLVNHDIKLTSADPLRSKPYPLPHALRDTIKDEVKSMLKMRVIEPSESPYASPIVLVMKKDGTQQFCIDFRRLNRITIFDAEPMPDPDEIFTKLAKDRYFTKIDLSKGYWQIPLHDQAKEKTAFITPDGLYQFRTMPFGLVNAPATFSRMMRTMLRGMSNIDNFIDDILVHTKTWEEHLNTLEHLFQRLKKSGLTARPTKCFVGFNKLEYLGHIVGQGQLEPLPDKLTTIQNAPQPKTKKQLRSFLGLTGYYRKFIPNYAAIAVPLTDRTKKREPNHIKWENSQEFAFQTLKERLTTSPVLRLPDCNKLFLLRTDASDIGIGVVLLQREDNVDFPVAYASKKLLPRERSYSTIERECLAIVWAIQKFQTYLYGRAFVLETDHQPLVYLQRAKVTNGRILRWALSLQPYRFRIEAIKGSENVGADYLSRRL